MCEHKQHNLKVRDMRSIDSAALLPTDGNAALKFDPTPAIDKTKQLTSKGAANIIATLPAAKVVEKLPTKPVSPRKVDPTPAQTEPEVKAEPKVEAAAPTPTQKQEPQKSTEQDPQRAAYFANLRNRLKLQGKLK